MEEIIITDTIIDHYKGKIKIYDGIFELELDDKEIISGNLSDEISREYREVHSNDFFGTIGKTIVYNKAKNDTYIKYRLIELIL